MNATPRPHTFLRQLFPESDRYRSWGERAPLRIAEPDPDWEPFTERHLHCVWFDPKLRPRTWVSTRGEEVRILHPGDWNHGKGPDFLDAEWTVDGRHYQGDVEIHIRPMDWVHHGHTHDPAYGRVRLHVTYDPGELGPGQLPEGCTQVAMKEELEKRSHFFFESVDLSAYPWDRDGTANGLRKWFDDQSDEACGKWLEAAGQERLRRKTQRMNRLIRSVGPREALYQALMRGLGYHHNADSAEQLARALPLSHLEHHAGGDPVKAFALLNGCAGLLPEAESDLRFPDWFPLRTLWDVWWRKREAFDATRLLPERWRMDGCRPGNLPARRFWAAAIWQNRLADWSPAEEETDPEWKHRLLDELQVRSPEEGAESRVVGPQRAAALFVNAVLPWRFCVGATPPDAGILHRLPSEPMNSRTRRAAHRFLGPDRHPRIYRGGLRRQGLLQLAEDYGA